MQVRAIALAVVVLLAILLALGIRLVSTGRTLLAEAERAKRHTEFEDCAAALAERVEHLRDVVQRVAASDALEALTRRSEGAVDHAESYAHLDDLLAELSRDAALQRVTISPLDFGPPLAGYDRARGDAWPSLLEPPSATPEVVARASSQPPHRLLIDLVRSTKPSLLAAYRTGRGWIVVVELEVEAALERAAAAAEGGTWVIHERGKPIWPPAVALPFPPGKSVNDTWVEDAQVRSSTEVTKDWSLLVEAPLRAGFSNEVRVALGMAALTVILVLVLGIYAARASSLGQSLVQSERQERELQGTFDAITDPVLVLDRELRVLRTNRAAEARPGQHYAEVVSARAVNEPLAETEALANVIRKGEPRTAELQAGERVLTVAQFPVFAPDLSVAGVVETVRDVTQNRALQAQLVQSDKLSTLGEMAAGIAHEINNPIGVISMFAQLLSEELKEHEGLEAALAQVSTIEEQAANVGDIVKGLLRFARKSEGVRTRFAAGRAIERALAIVEHQKILKGVTLERDIDASAQVLGDEGQLAQVILNLVVNASHAMEGSGTLGLSVTQRTPEDPPPAGRCFGVSEDEGDLGPRVAIAVRDSGSGIPPAKLERIFEPFFTTKEAGVGTGLGLSVGFAIVRDHGGCFWVASEEGQGTTFTIDLPAAPEQESE